jgi:hypothetical protein
MRAPEQRYNEKNTRLKAISSGPLAAVLGAQKHEEWGPYPPEGCMYVVFCCTGHKRDAQQGISKKWGFAVDLTVAEFTAHCVVRVGERCTRASDGMMGWKVEDLVKLVDEDGKHGLELPKLTGSRPKLTFMKVSNDVHRRVLASANTAAACVK